MSLPPYAELHCRSNFSFLTAASKPEELVQRVFGLASRIIEDPVTGTPLLVPKGRSAVR